MPRDYVRYVNKQKRPLVEHGWRKRLLFVAFLLLLLSGLTYGVYVYQSRAEDGPQSIGVWVKQVITLFKKTSNDQRPQQQPMDSSEVVDAKPDADIQFSFYTNLATMQVSAPPASPSEVVIENKTKSLPVVKPIERVDTNQTVVSPTVSQTKAIDERYLLQIAAFKNPTAAGEMRISLLLAGFEVEIVKAMRDGQLLYQLQQGPFSTVAEAKAMQRELKKKDIESVIVKKIT